MFSTAAVMKIDQNILMYLITYLLTLFSAFLACLKLILKIRKTNPINIRSFTATKKIISEKTKEFTSKNLLFNIALRNIKRNLAKSTIQTVTLVVSFLLCLIISNVFAIVGVKSVKTAADFSDYSIQANIFMNFDNQTDSEDMDLYSFFTEEDLELLRSMDNVKKVYTENILIDYNWDKESEPDDAEESNTLQIMLYDDELLQKFAEINDIVYDPSKPFSVLLSGQEYEDEEFNIHSSQSDNKFTVKPDYRLRLENHLNYALFHLSNLLIINEKLAESNNIENTGYCTFLVETDCTLSELSDIPFSVSETYVTNLHDGQDEAEAQLIGMVIIAGYIVAATIVLSFMIISNTIKENMASKKSEYGVMRAMGLKLKDLWTVACHENFILTMIAVAISIPLSFIVNAYLSLILFEEVI